MSAKFTPGPYVIRYDTNVFAWPWGRLVASTGGHSSNVNTAQVHAENVANARLIAAAPVLYAALKTVQANRASAERGDSCGLATCTACGEDMGWLLESATPPVCEDCHIAAALALVDEA